MKHSATSPDNFLGATALVHIGNEELQCSDEGELYWHGNGAAELERLVVGKALVKALMRLPAGASVVFLRLVRDESCPAGVRAVRARF